MIPPITSDFSYCLLPCCFSWLLCLSFLHFLLFPQGIALQPSRLQLPDLAEARVKLRNTMHGKIHLVPYDPYTPLLHQFLPKANPKAKSIPNIFAKAPAFSSEREMYKWIVRLLILSSL